MIRDIFWSILAILRGFIETVMNAVEFVLLFKVPHWRLPSGPLANYIPFLGALTLFVDKTPSYLVLAKIAENYKRIFRLEFGQTTYIVICDHVLLQDTFDKDVVCGRSLPKMMDVMEGKGIIQANGECWKSQRLYVNQVLRHFGLPRTEENKSFDQKASGAIAVFLKELEDSDGSPMNLDESLCFTLANIFFSTVVGKTFERDDELLKDIIESSHKSFRSMRPISFANFIQPVAELSVNKKVLQDVAVRKERFTNYIQAIIKEHRVNLEPENAKDFIDSYLTQISSGRTHFTEPQLQAILGDLFTSNMEPTVATLHWLILALATYPELQIKIREQLVQVTRNERTPNLDDRIHLPHLEALILEGYRFSSICPIGVPHMATEDTKIAGYHVPKNATVVGLFWKFNRNPRIWGNPNEFDPNNHLNRDGVLVKTQDLMPYSTGRRACLNEAVANDEIFLILANLLLKFEIREENTLTLPSMEASIEGMIRTPLPFKVRAVRWEPPRD